LCQYGHGVVRDIFGGIDAERLKGFVVFLPMLEGDERAAAVAQAAELNDPRVAQLWDPERDMGELSARTLGLSSTAWDVYLVYPPGVTWDAEIPPLPTFWMHQLPSEIGAD
jgi:hypothetical protein